jgi:hypothetical protein
MHFASRRSEILVMVAALALPFKAGGCGRTSCLTLSKAQIQSGICPSQSEAAARINGPNNCGFNSTTTTIEGDGTLDGELCCYPVSEQTVNTICGFGAGGSPGGTTGFGGETTSTATGFVGTGGSMPGCAPCNAALQGTPFDLVCGLSMARTDLQNLEMCGCGNTCMSVCDQTLCIGNKPSDGCMSCLQSGCLTQLVTCQNN